MSRMYIINHWSDAAAYSGEQIGDRLSDSQALHFNRDGSANTSLYAEPQKKTKAKPITKQSLVESIIPQEKRYANLEAKLTQLEKNKHLMTFEEYSELRVVLERKITRAWTLLERARGWGKEEEKPKQNKALPREILIENKRSPLKAKQTKPKTENVKHDRKSLSKVADWINRNDWAYLMICSTIALTAAKIIF